MTKIAFLFSGQGSQYVGMGKDFYENIPECKKIFDDADKALGYSISDMCFNGPKELLDVTENTQPAILTHSIAAMKALELKGINPDIVCGLSLGEYSALIACGALDFKDGVKLIKLRGKYMSEAVPRGKGSMAAIIGLEDQVVIDTIKEISEENYVTVANLNCPMQVVISGETNGVNKACEILKEKGAMKTIILDVSGPFHSNMLNSASDKLEEKLKEVKFKNFNIPVLTNVTGGYMDEGKIAQTLKYQMCNTVYFRKNLETLLAEGVDTFIEVGPGKVLSGFVKKVNRNVTILNVEDTKSLEKVFATLKGEV